jgi:hypothetical protein
MVGVGRTRAAVTAMERIELLEDSIMLPGESGRFSAAKETVANIRTVATKLAMYFTVSLFRTW